MREPHLSHKAVAKIRSDHCSHDLSTLPPSHRASDIFHKGVTVYQHMDDGKKKSNKFRELVTTLQSVVFNTVLVFTNSSYMDIQYFLMLLYYLWLLYLHFYIYRGHQ